MKIHRMVKSGDYKLIVYPAIDKVLLYNLKEDPHEMHNLADNPLYEKKVEEMFDKLKELQKEMDDPLKGS